METIADMPPAAFDALAALNIYFFADLAWPSVKSPRQRRRMLHILHEHDILTECADPETAADAIQRRYNQAIEDHVGNEMPDGYEPTHDYWGAKCIVYHPKWNAPKNGTFFTGDAACYYMAFSSALAMKEYTDRILGEIEEAQDDEEYDQYEQEDQHDQEELLSERSDKTFCL